MNDNLLVSRFLALQLEGVDPRSKIFNIVPNDHGRTQKRDFGVSVGETNFTDRETPDTIKGFRDLVLVCKMQDCYCTIRKKFRPSHQVIQVTSD